MTTAAENLVAAHIERAERVDVELQHVRTGWALFTPQRVNDLIDERNRAVTWVHYWTGVGR